MPEFIYTARDFQGALHQDTVEATTAREAAGILHRRGLFPVRLKKTSTVHSLWRLWQSRWSRRYQMIFFRQLSVMVRAGLPVSECLRILSEAETSAAGKRLVRGLYGQVQDGSTLSDAMKRQGKAFSRLAVYLVGVGELSGSLETVLESLAAHLEEQYISRTKLVTLMLYPMVLLVVTLAAALFLLRYVLPVFAGLFASLGTELPWPTRFIMNLYDVLQQYGWLLLVGMFFGGAAFSFLYRRESVRVAVDQWILRLPVLGSMLLYTEWMHFSRTLSVLLHSGIVIDRAMAVLQDTTANSYIRQLLQKAQHDVERGLLLSVSLRQSRMFPPLLMELLAVGETTGEMDFILDKMAQFCQLESLTLSERLRSLMEPAMLLFMGGVIGLIVFAIALPVLDSMSAYQY